MRPNSRVARALSAALILAGAVAPAESVFAREHRASFAPIYVATPRHGSPITPYFFPYGAGYRYNSPGPVFARLYDWDADPSCRIWRYNYLYWAC
jgi:hypothetical protein